MGLSPDPTIHHPPEQTTVRERPNEYTTGKTMTTDDGTEPYPWRDSDKSNPKTGGKRDEKEKTSETIGGDNLERDESESGLTDSQPRVVDDHIDHPEKVGPGTKTDPATVEKSHTAQKTVGVGEIKTAYNSIFTDIKACIPFTQTRGGAKTGLSGFFYPDGMLREDEQVVFEIHPTRWLDARHHFTGVVMMAIGVAIAVVVLVGFGEELINAPLPGSHRPVPEFWYVVPGVLILMGGMFYLYAAVQRASTWYILTQNRLLKRKGILRREDKRLDLTDINKTNTIRPLHMALFRVGHIDVYTAATGDAELRIEACRHINDRSEAIDYQSKLADMTPEERKELADQYAEQAEAV